jgi:hypothetical protein
LATDFPVVAIAMNFLQGDPHRDIKEKIDQLSTKIDRYQQENQINFDNIRTDICVNEMNDEVSLLLNLDDMIKRSNGTYSPYLIASYCGDNSGLCYRAFNSIADNLPKCADKMIESSVFTQDGLALKGYAPEYNKLAICTSEFIAPTRISYG